MSETLDTSAARPADPCAMVIFGAAGGLTKRKLVPSIYNLARNGLLSKQIAVIGLAVDELDDASFQERMTEAIKEFSTTPFDPTLWETLRPNFRYVTGNFSDPAAYARLKE